MDFWSVYAHEVKQQILVERKEFAYLITHYTYILHYLNKVQGDLKQDYFPKSTDKWPETQGARNHACYKEMGERRATEHPEEHKI